MSWTTPAISKTLALLLVTLAIAAAVISLRSPPGRTSATPPPMITFADAQGRSVTLDAFRGKFVILNFWATWCKPCRDEFPAFDRLQARWGPKGLVVVPVSIDRMGLPAVDRFYRELAIANLAKYTDENRAAVRTLGLRGVPSTLLIDRQDREVARFEGPVDWEGSAIGAVLARLAAD